jgi:protein TonB
MNAIRWRLPCYLKEHGGSATVTDQVLALGQREIARSPVNRRIRSGAIAAAVVLHLIVFAILVRTPRPSPVRVGMAQQDGISAFVNVTPVPTGTSGIQQPAKKMRVISMAPAPETAQQTPATAESSGSPQSTTGAAQGGAPVRMSPGQLQLIKEVDPVYPPLMLAAKSQGTVVLDAIIHADGTIGDVTVLKSLSSLFDRAAVDAVKQWRYTPLGYEGIVNVTVKFTLR